MNGDFRQLMARPVIRLEDISLLRSQIEQRHPDMDSDFKSQLMADGINRMLDAAMTGLDSVYKENIKKKLIEEQLIGSRQSVLKMDVLNRILALDVKPETLLSKTWGWYVLNTGHSVTLSDFTEQVSPYLPHRLRTTIRDNEEKLLTFRRSSDEAEPVDCEVSETNKHVENTAVDFPIKNIFNLSRYRLTQKGRRIIQGVAISAFLICSVSLIVSMDKGGETDVPPSESGSPVIRKIANVPSVFEASIENVAIGKPEYMKYQNFSIEALKTYLEQKNSKLLENDYLDQLLAYCYEKDLNPLLLIAIIGQEQNYVPMNHRYADQIIENPFNIYGSWETHPVGFSASMKEACYTINKILADRTMYQDPFVRINSKYAEDPRWNVGVKVIFRDLIAIAGQ